MILCHQLFWRLFGLVQNKAANDTLGIGQFRSGTNLNWRINVTNGMHFCNVESVWLGSEPEDCDHFALQYSSGMRRPGFPEPWARGHAFCGLR